MWHPAGKPVDEVIAWRDLLERERIVQPFKQAHREVYLLTPVEREAGLESARFSGHVLSQHKLRALCDARGWAYKLQGQFDPGPNPNPTVRLPGLGVVAELAIEPVEDESLQSGHGIFLYVETGSLTFRSEPVPGAKVAPTGDPAQLLRLHERPPVPLHEIPPLVPNVMVAPDNRHLCILSGGVRRPGEPGYTWLPFAGDDALSAIISKAMLLARDGMIEDPSIRVQIFGI